MYLKYNLAKKVEVIAMPKYVISEDICIILPEWGKPRKILIPDSNFFSRLRLQMKSLLEDIFGDQKVVLVPAAEIQAGLKKYVAATDFDIVSLDPWYYRGDYHLEINRVVDAQLMNQGERERFGHLPIAKQIDRLRQAQIKEVALLDDVVFTGNNIADLIDKLQRQGIRVRLVIAGVAVAEGIKKMKELGVKLEAVRRYELIIDEICERDFYPGVPHSGRTVIGHNHNVGAPYLIPFGKPAEWASIPPAWVEEFSRFCLRQSLELWQEIGQLNGRHITCQELSRLPRGISPDGRKFIDILQNIYEQRAV